jgi:hypothetical protein
MNEHKQYKAMSKYQLANCADVQWRVFRRWIKKDLNELEKMGYNKNMKLLNPAIVRFLCEKYVIYLE